MTDYKAAIIKMLKRHMAESGADTFKKRAYDKVIKQLQEVTAPVQNMSDLDNLDMKGIGKSIRAKIVDVFDQPPVTENTNVDRYVKELEVLQMVHGIGPKKAEDPIKNHNIKTIEDLGNPELLNNKQLLGLKYVRDFEKRIPRAEMDKHVDVFWAAVKDLNDIHFEFAGSYRRGGKSSGDIDILVTFASLPHSDLSSMMNIIIEELVKKKYIKDIFAQGDTKFNGICRLPRFKTHRRIDIMITDSLQYPFALLYFTGSKEFNVKMRNHALVQDYLLNEHGLSKVGKKEKLVLPQIKTEEDVFKFLGMEYVPPTLQASRSRLLWSVPIRLDSLVKLQNS